jgi:hypothetical protein
MYGDIIIGSSCLDNMICSDYIMVTISNGIFYNIIPGSMKKFTSLKGHKKIKERYHSLTPLTFLHRNR